MLEKDRIWFRSPMVVHPSISTWEAILVPFPIDTCSPITEYAPISTSSAMRALGWMIAVGCMLKSISRPYLSTIMAISSASATTAPSTFAVPLKAMTVPRCFVSSMSKRTWSPGRTGFRNFALSMLMK